MGDQDQRRSGFGIHAEQQVDDGLAGAVVEVAGGFVGKQHGGLDDEGAGNRHALFFTAGQLVRVVALAGLQADRPDGLQRGFRGVFGARQARAAASRFPAR